MLAWNSRSASPTLSIAKALEELQSALQKSGIDRATTRPTAEGAEVEHGILQVPCHLLGFVEVGHGAFVHLDKVERACEVRF